MLQPLNLDGSFAGPSGTHQTATSSFMCRYSCRKRFFSLKASEIFNNKKLLFFAKKSTFFYKKSYFFLQKKVLFFGKKKCFSLYGSEGEEGYVTVASHCNDEAGLDEEEQEPSMEMESAPPRPVVPMPAAPTASSSTPDPQSQNNPRNPALLLQPEDLCLAVWAEDGVRIYCS